MTFEQELDELFKLNMVRGYDISVAVKSWARGLPDILLREIERRQKQNARVR